MQSCNLIQGCVFTGERKGEGQRVLLLRTDVSLRHEVLQRLCHVVKQLQGENRRLDKKKVRREHLPHPELWPRYLLLTSVSLPVSSSSGIG